jgi:hypothetical protein
MEAQKPAEGILKQGDFGLSKFYYIQCDCGNEDCSHTVEVEANDFGIQVQVYIKSHTKWWDMNRWLQIWQILTKGHAEMQTTIVMNEQTSLNYAETLKIAINDVKNFRANIKVDNQNK